MRMLKHCIRCGKKLPTSRWKYCSYECYSIYNREKFDRDNPTTFRGNNSSTTGAISELRVAVDLMCKGYNVFRALSPSCPCDLAVLKNGKLLRIEVRTTYRSQTGQPNKVKASRDDKDNIDIYASVLADEIIYEPTLE